MKYVSFVLAATFATPALSKEFRPESATDCLDRFQQMAINVSKNGAVLGSARVTSIDQPHLSKTFEWFLVDQRRLSRNKPSRNYSESRILYPHAPDSNVWEKRYVADRKLYRALGDYLSPLLEVKRDDEEEEDRYLSKYTVGAPNLFAVSVCGPSTLLKDMTVFNRILNGYTVFEEDRDGGDVIGKFYGNNFVSEIRFSKKSSFMPTEMKSFFYSPKQRGAAPSSPEDYKILWCESEVEWEQLDKDNDVWVPIEVRSILHRMSRRSKRGQEVEAAASWELELNDSLFSDENIEQLPLDGPVANLRKHLLAEKADIERKPR